MLKELVSAGRKVSDEKPKFARMVIDLPWESDSVLSFADILENFEGTSEQNLAGSLRAVVNYAVRKRVEELSK